MKYPYIFLLSQHILVIILLLISTRQSAAQYQNGDNTITWSKVPEEQFEVKECTFEKDARSVVLSDHGHLIATSNTPIILQRHKRIKILKEEGLKDANVALRYISYNDLEIIENLEAQTINRDENGKVHYISVKPDQVFKTELRESLMEISIAFPDVRVGSILEFRYTYRTKNIFHPDPWYFQDHIPTLHSELQVDISGDLTYKAVLFGDRLKANNSLRQREGKWIVSDVPSLPEEPYVWNHKDYAERIEFQLASYLRPTPAGTYREVKVDWDDLIENYLKSDGLKKFLGKDKVAEKLSKKIPLRGKPVKEKIQVLNKYIHENFTWNGKLGVYPDKTLKELLNNKEGNSATLNLFMTVILREFGLNTYPAALSTKPHGIVAKNLANMYQFNNLVCVVMEKGETLIIDNHDKAYPYDILEEMNLNQDALILDQRYSRWLNITPDPRSTKSTIISLDLPAEEASGSPSGTVSMSFHGYAAIHLRKTLASNEEEDYLKALFRKNQVQLENISVNAPKEQSQSINGTMDIQSLEDWGEDRVYFSPIFLNDYDENPFKSSTRLLPIDLVYPHKEYYVMKITLPETYEIEEVPEDLQIKLPKNGGSFIYAVQKIDNSIQVTSRVTLKRSTFTVLEYPYLKEFFDLIREKLSEQIVLKKKKI